LQWIRDKAFTPLRFAYGGTVLAYIDVQTRQWGFVNFAYEFYYQHIYLFSENDFIIHMEECVFNGLYQFNVYKQSIR
jgi:hypothetical protein